MKTSERLAVALVEAGAPPVMIDRARVGYYDDFRSPLPAPITTLVADARAYRLEDIANRAIAGEFDSTREEADEWARSAAGRAAFSNLLPTPPKGIDAE